MSKKEAIRSHSQRGSGEGCCVIISYIAPTCEYHLRAVAKGPHLAECTSRCPEGLAQPGGPRSGMLASVLYNRPHQNLDRSPKWIKFSLGFCDQGGKGRGRGGQPHDIWKGNFSTSDFAEAFKASTQDPGPGASTDTRRLSLLTAASFPEIEISHRIAWIRTVHLQGL